MSKITPRQQARIASAKAAKELEKAIKLWEDALGIVEDMERDASRDLDDIGGLLQRMSLSSLRGEVNEFFVAQRIVEAQGRDVHRWLAMWAPLDKATENYLSKRTLEDLPLEHEMAVIDSDRYRKISEFYGRLADRIENGLRRHAVEIKALKHKRSH